MTINPQHGFSRHHQNSERTVIVHIFDIYLILNEDINFLNFISFCTPFVKNYKKDQPKVRSSTIMAQQTENEKQKGIPVEVDFYQFMSSEILNKRVNLNFC